MDKSKKISIIHITNIKGLNTIRKNSVHRKANTKDVSWICLQMNDRYHNLSRGIAMKSVLPYDVSQEQYLFDEDGFTKKTQKNTLILQPEKNLTKDNKKPDFNDQIFKSGAVLDVVAIF